MPTDTLSIPSTSSSTPLSSNPITPEDSPICTPEHAYYAFDVLVAHFESRPSMSPPFAADKAFALFVTWNTDAHHRSGSHGKKPALRGCIGNFSPLPLGKGLKEYALVSGLQDHRFSPIEQSELPHLSVSISLLTPFTLIPDPLSWIPGIHGIHITFPDPHHPRKSLSATYLPEVTPEQGWTREEAILSAIGKAGYRGHVKVGDEVWKSLKVRVYSSQKAGVSWADYVKWKADREGQVDKGVKDAQEED